MSERKVKQAAGPKSPDLTELVRGIVLAQGNVFIKELLRSKDIKIGATKADFEDNMLRAVQDGKLTQSDIDRWLDEVEGWGDQHVYLYKVPDSIALDAQWDSPDTVLGKLAAAELDGYWNANTSFEYPDEQKLTGIYLDEGSLRFIWHQGRGSWLRTPAQDLKKTIDGDQYKFHAYRFRGERSVMRFELRPRERVAAVFLQIPWSISEHQQALQEVRSIVRPLIDLDALEKFSSSDAIKKLDQKDLDQRQDGSAADPQASALTAHRTRLNDAGVYVEFANTAEGKGYKESEPVRHVRRALQAQKFTGASGVFVYHPDDAGGARREANIELFGGDRGIRIWAQLTAKDVWDIVGFLKEYG